MCAQGLRSPVENDGASPRPRPRRWVRGALRAGAVALAVALAAPFVIARGLDGPWLKGRVRALVRRTAGLDIDYRTLRLSYFSGVSIEGLVVQSPADVASFAPELLRAGRIDAAWSVGSLLGSGPKLERLSIEDLALNVVIDEHGRTSFDAIPSSAPPQPPPAPPPPVPLSKMAAKRLASAPPVRRVDLTRVVVSLIRTDRGQVVERDGLQGLGAALAIAPAEHGWKVHAELGTPGAPLDLAVQRAPAGAPAADARAKLSLVADVSGAALDAAADVRVDRQSFLKLGADASLAGQSWLHAEVGARFDSEHGMTSIALKHAQAAAGAATAEASVDLPDTGDPVVHSARGDVDAARLLAWAPPGLVPATASRATVHYEVDGLVAGAEPRFAEGGGLTVDADLAGVAVRVGDQAMNVEGAKLSAHGVPAPDGGVSAKGSVKVTSARVDAPAAVIGAADVSLDFDGARAGDGAITGQAGLRFGRVSRDARARAGSLAARDGRFDLTLDGVRPNPADPPAIRGKVDLVGGAGGLSTRASDGDTAADAFAIQAHVDVPSAGAADYTIQLGAGSFAKTPAVGPGWKAGAIALRSAGHVEGWRGGSPSVRHETHLEAQGLDLGRVTARSIDLSLRSQGDATRHEGTLDLKAVGLVFDRAAPSDDHVTLAAKLDRSRPSLHVDLKTEGRVASKLTATVSFDRTHRAIVYDVDGHIGSLAPIAPALAGAPGLEGFDFSKLELSVTARGDALGVVSRVTGDGVVDLEPQPLRTALVEGTVDVRADHLRWAQGDTAFETPSATWHGTFGGAVGRRTLDSHIEVASFHLGLGRNQLDLGGVVDEASAVVTRDLSDPDVALTQKLAVQTVRQDFLPPYPVGDVDLSLAMSRDHDGIFHVSEMNARNGAGGTAVDLTGGVDLGAGRRRLSINATVDQNLAPLSTEPRRFEGSGAVHFTATVESPDMAIFRARLDLKAAGVRVRAPRAGLEIDGLDGEIPVNATFDVGQDGVSMRRSLRLNPYSLLRFADQHPLMVRSGYISVARLKTPFATVAPLVGNLEVDQNVVSLRQFEMGLRGGHVSGECALDWEGKHSTVELHVRANGVQSSHGEPFDGNIAVSFAAADRSVEGRAEVLRIGPRHLLDLLDMQDPTHVDPVINRVRGALALGYPKHLRLVFDHGFASAKLDLGGLGSLISIGELHGIPMGPIIDKFLSPALDNPDKQQDNQ